MSFLNHGRGCCRAAATSLLLFLACCAGSNVSAGGDSADAGSEVRVSDVVVREVVGDVHQEVRDPRDAVSGTDICEMDGDAEQDIGGEVGDVPGDTPCLPECGARVCGPDGCGDVCGHCSGGEECVEGECVCVPQCDDGRGPVCGDDGCGGTSTCLPNGKEPLCFGPGHCVHSEELDEVGWFCGNSDVEYLLRHSSRDCIPPWTCEDSSEAGRCIGLQPVAQKSPNGFGLWDVLGNILEYSGSLFRQYTEETQVDPDFDEVIEYQHRSPGDPVELLTEARGGNFVFEPVCSHWRKFVGAMRYRTTFGGPFGFRIARTLPTPDAPLVVSPAR